MPEKAPFCRLCAQELKVDEEVDGKDGFWMHLSCLQFLMGMRGYDNNKARQTS